jgi:hypothetical protein
MKFEKGSTTLNEILNRQRSPFDRVGLGYNGEKEATNEETSTREKRTKSYANIIKNYIKGEDNMKEDQYVP